MKLATTLATVIALAFLAGFAPAQDDDLIWKAADFELTDPAGKKHKLSSFGDKVVVLEWTNHDCPFVKRLYEPSDKEPGAMQKLSAKYRKKGVVWMAIDSTPGHEAADLKKIAAALSIEHPILIDKNGTVGKLYGAKTSTHVFVAQKGKILYQGAVDDGPRGNAKTDYLADALDLVLAGKPVVTRSTKPYGCAIKYPAK